MVHFCPFVLPIPGSLQGTYVPPVETEAATTEEIWANLKTGLLKTTEEVCGSTKPLPPWRCETWWWNKEVDDAITRAAMFTCVNGSFMFLQ